MLNANQFKLTSVTFVSSFKDAHQIKWKNLSPIDRFWKLLKPDAKEIRNIYL
jgi:hypothetical protein